MSNRPLDHMTVTRLTIDGLTLPHGLSSGKVKPYGLNLRGKAKNFLLSKENSTKVKHREQKPL